MTVKKSGGISRRVRMTSRVVLRAPIKAIFEKAALNGFFKVRGGEYVSTKLGRCVNAKHLDILRYYNSVIHTVLNCYSFVNNKKSLGSFVHGLKLSCARTLALKYKLRHASKVYKKFGYMLRSPEASVELFIPSTFKAIKKFDCNVVVPDDIFFSNRNNKVTKSNLFKVCLICGSNAHVVMHHVPKVRGLESKTKEERMDFFMTQVASRNHKQVSQCFFRNKPLRSSRSSASMRGLPRKF
jgi:hypothetical protein